jgi:hypothetical protein
MKVTNVFSRLQLGRLELNRKDPDIEMGFMAADTFTIHFFKLKALADDIPDIDQLNIQEEESKVSEFFRKLKDHVDKVLPNAMTNETSSLRIYLEPETT